MPITKSAQKALRQNVRRRVNNLSKNKALKVEIKNYKKLVLAGEMAEAEKHLSKVYKILDKSAKTGLIKKNKSSRLKSRLSHKLKAKSTKTSS
jgi:small subunit ribosomal protein S20